jgi:hypothetical protein
VALIHNTAGAVAVEKVDCEVEGLREQLEGVVSLKEEVQKVGAHEPLNLSLNLN